MLPAWGMRLAIWRVVKHQCGAAQTLSSVTVRAQASRYCRWTLPTVASASRCQQAAARGRPGAAVRRLSRAAFGPRGTGLRS